MNDHLPALLDEILAQKRAASGAVFSVHSPSLGTAIADVADMGAEDARVALDQATAAFETWKQTAAYERAALLRKWFDLIMEHAHALATITALEMGKPITEALGEVRYAASFIEWYAEEAKRLYGDVFASQHPQKRLFAIKQPVGVVYGITPWNFPSAMITRKVAPALAAGCVFIAKPAEQSPLTAIYMEHLWYLTGAPAGTFTVLPAMNPIPVSQVLIADARVRKLSFTGSTEVGKLLYAQSAATVKRISLELGGHAPFLIFEDADLTLAVKEVIACKFRNAGQTCVCTNRIYVQESIAAAFTAEMVKAAQTLKLGDPLDKTTQIGPLVDAAGLAKVQAHVEDAIQRGAQVLTGGKVAQGLFYEPTIITDVPHEALMLHEETFGPVAPIITFREDAEAIQLANDVPFGLAAYLYTNNINRAMRVAEALEYGIIGLNDGVPSTAQAPFGGVKASGLGREGGKWGIEEYIEVKFISLALH